MEKINSKIKREDGDFIHINIPMKSETDNLDRTDTIEKDYVENELAAAIGEPYDNERYQIYPFNLETLVNQIKYHVHLIDHDSEGDLYLSELGSVGFTQDDVKFNRNVFKRSFLTIELYDEPNDLNNSLVSSLTIQLKLYDSDYLKMGNGFIKGVRDVNQIQLRFEANNPKYYTFLNNEGYFLYLEKKELGTKLFPKYLYMKCQFKNAKTGLTHHLGKIMGKLNPDEIQNSRFMKLKLVDDNNSFRYEFENEENVSVDNDFIVIDLFETKGK